MTDLIERLSDEADLCRNEGADDIARLLDEARVALEAAQRDAARLDWIQRQGLDDFAMGLVVDAPHDGEYWVSPDSGGMYYGKTLRAAIDAAIEAAKKGTQ